jgi:hypothetical protein
MLLSPPALPLSWKTASPARNACKLSCKHNWAVALFERRALRHSEFNHFEFAHNGLSLTYLCLTTYAN